MVRTFLLAGAMLLFTCYSYAQKCDCDLIKKRNDNNADNSLQEFMNGDFIQESDHPYTTFRRDDIGGINISARDRLGTIRQFQKTYLSSISISANT